MAFVDNTTYTGKDAQGFYSAALLTGNTKSVIQVYPEVKSSLKIARLDMANILQEADCTFTDGGTTTLSQKTLTVCALKVNLEYCQRTFEANYLSEQLRAGSNNGEVMPASVEEYILNQVSQNISADLENLIWQGDTAGSPASVCDGFLKAFVADNSVVDVVGTTVTAANVYTEIGKVYAAIPATIRFRGKVVIFISNAIAGFFKQAQGATTGGLFITGDKELNYLGVPLIIAPGLPTNDMVAAEPDNLWFGTDLMSDFEDVMIIPQKAISGAPTVRIVAEFKFGVNYGVSEEIVYYT
jgi:hypothetical protein